ncbi:MAG: NAD(P)H-binding protein [Bacteroidota bacterium]
MPHYALIGATGLIGSHILAELLQQPDATVTILLRKPLNLNNPRVQEVVVDFTNEKVLTEALAGCEAVFVSIGTTQKKVRGDLSAYRKIDYDIPVAAANACVANAIPKLLVVSSVGANSRSNNFYLRIKGEVEDAIANRPIPYIRIFQPSLLLGNRTEFRLGEKISQIIMPWIGFLFPARYKPIAATTVALAMVQAATTSEKGVKRYTYSDMKQPR